MHPIMKKALESIEKDRGEESGKVEQSSAFEELVLLCHQKGLADLGDTTDAIEYFGTYARDVEPVYASDVLREIEPFSRALLALVKMYHPDQPDHTA